LLEFKCSTLSEFFIDGIFGIESMEVIDVKVEELFTLFVDKVSITGSSSTSENSLSG
jgi:hypothetical protein